MGLWTCQNQGTVEYPDSTNYVLSEPWTQVMKLIWFHILVSFHLHISVITDYVNEWCLIKYLKYTSLFQITVGIIPIYFLGIFVEKFVRVKSGDSWLTGSRWVIENYSSRARGMAQCAEHLLCNHEDLSSDPQNLYKWSTSLILELLWWNGSQETGISGGLWACSSVVCSSEHSRLSQTRERARMNIWCHLLTSTCALCHTSIILKHLNICSQMKTQKCTHI